MNPSQSPDSEDRTDTEQEPVVDVREGPPDGPGGGGEPETDITRHPEGDLDAVGTVGGPSLSAALEAILLVVDEPVGEVTLAQVLERPTSEVALALAQIASEYDEAARGFELRQVAGGWRLYTRAACASVVERFVVDGQQARLTQAALETLSVVAYRQPVSRARISAIRGVNVDGVVRTLVSRGLIEECGSEPDSGALLYQTTSVFLERLGLRSLEELPELGPLMPDIQSLDHIHDSI
jgi:segregation and condensation protein B